MSVSDVLVPKKEVEDVYSSNFWELGAGLIIFGVGSGKE
jgi:hypothetical protein